MNPKRFTALGLILVMLIFTSCQPAANSFTIIDNLSQLPQEVRTWVNAYHRIFVGTSKTSGRYTYILVSAGPSSDPQQSLSIVDIKEESDALVVEVDMTERSSPATDTSQMHYPYALARIRKTDKPIEYRSITNPDLWIPRAIGAPTGFLPQWADDINYSDPDPQIILGHVPGQAATDQPGQVIAGLARIFEATVEYDYLDEQGNPAGRNFVMASTGPPIGAIFNSLLSRYLHTKLFVFTAAVLKMAVS